MPRGRSRIPQRFLGALIAALTGLAAHASNGRLLILENLSTHEGLPQGTVMATLQDSQGFVWLGTEDGLVRFDGHEVYRYAYSPTAKAGLPGNFVDAIAEDKSGNLWIGIKGAGLAYWQRTTDAFTVYRHDASNDSSLSSDAVRTILIDSKGLIWIGTLDNGLDLLDPSTERIQHFRHDPEREDSLADNQVQSLLQDGSGTIWVGTHAGLDRLSADRSRFIHQDDSALKGRHISRVMEDAQGSLWVGTFDAGLYNVDPTRQVVTAFTHDPSRSSSLTNNDVRAILDDHAGHLWVGTADGLDYLNRATNEFAHYRHDKSDPDSLSDSFVMSLYQDSSGLVWIGMRAAGVSRWNPHSWELGGHRPDWLDGKLVTSFADAPDGQLWIGSLGGGLVRFNPETGESSGIDTLVGRPDSLGDPRVMSLRVDRQGTLWIGTMTNGLKKLFNGRIASIPVRPGDAHSLSAPGIMTIYEANNGLLWIGTHGGGANVLDPATGAVRQLPFGSKRTGAISAGNVTSFAEDRHGNVWIGTDSGGLNLARADGTVLKVFKHDPRDRNSLSANTVYSIAVDSSGDIWIATDGGGMDEVVGSSAEPNSIRFRNFSHADGLSSDTVYGALPDAVGHLWLSGNAGLTRFDTVSHAVKTYHREHGLQGEEFNFGAYYRARDGKLCFGGPGGFNVFDPLRLSGRRNPPRVVLTHLEVLGAPVQGAKPYWLTDHVDLDYRDNIVSFDFAALDFTSPNRNRLAYRMAGLTDQWINLSNQRRVTLTNLSAGNHVLEVKAVNADSIWSTTPLRLSIHKEPAPWQSAGAYTAYGFAIFAVIVLGLRAQRRKLRNALDTQQRLESEVALRTQELRETNRQLSEASEAKSHFLARMSHELRTPMNGVVGMAELLARTPLSASQARQTQTIRTSAQTLLQILNDLLDLSKVQAGKVQLESLPIDMTQLLEECAALFAGPAEAKGLDLMVCPPLNDQRDLTGDPLRIRQVLMNLIGNALKFTERGEIVVKCDLVPAEDDKAMVEISVSDTGIGINEGALERIFKPFAQADETMTRRFGGTGLGLSICQELVQLMDGSMSVDSQLQVGSTFRVSLKLKLGGEHAERRTASFAGAKARIVTRRGTLGESLRRYLSALAVQIIGTNPADEEVTAQSADLTIVDADSCLSAPELCVRAFKCRPLLIVASSAAMERKEVQAMRGVAEILPKPINRDSLCAALNVVLKGEMIKVDRQPRVASAPRARGHVLIVEDDAVNAAVAEGYLEQLGCTSAWVSDGQAAISRRAVEHFDLILMDLNMPGLDGRATTALIRKAERTGARVPIVALTANDANAYREVCLQAGMDDILTKPYTLQELGQLMSRWLVSTGELPVYAAAASPPALSTIDAATVAGLQNIRSPGRTDLYCRLVELFQKSSASAMAEIRGALSKGDLAAAAATCHKIKAGAANVGALAFAGLLGELEQRCQTGDRAAAQMIYEQLAMAQPALIQELGAFSLKATA